MSAGAGFYLHKKRLATAAASARATGVLAGARTFTSRDGLVSLVAPSTWKPIGGDDLSPAVDLGACSAAEDVLVFNVNEAAGDFDAELEVSGYAELVKGLYRENMKATFRDGERLELAGYPALRFPFDGSYGGIRLRGFLFALRSPANFHHFVLATVPSNYERLIGSGLAVLSTARIVPPPGAAAPTGTKL